MDGEGNRSRAQGKNWRHHLARRIGALRVRGPSHKRISVGNAQWRCAYGSRAFDRNAALDSGGAKWRKLRLESASQSKPAKPGSPPAPQHLPVELPSSSALAVQRMAPVRCRHFQAARTTTQSMSCPFIRPCPDRSTWPTRRKARAISRLCPGTT